MCECFTTQRLPCYWQSNASQTPYDQKLSVDTNIAYRLDSTKFPDLEKYKNERVLMIDESQLRGKRFFYLRQWSQLYFTQMMDNALY